MAEHKHSHGPHCNHAGHHHNHGHHGHHHHHAVPGRIGMAFALNLVFAVVELVGGFLTNSVAIISDAIHDFGDAMTLGMAWWLEKKSHQSATAEFSYGYRRLSVFAALVSGVVLIVSSLAILWFSIPRLLSPEPVSAPGMLALAGLGIVVNGLSFWRMSQGQSLTEKMLQWHFIEDLAGWVAVLIGALVIHFTGWTGIDAILACFIALWVMRNVWKNLGSSLTVFFQGVPLGLNEDQVKTWIKKNSEVRDVHHIHIWSLDGQEHLLTGHVVLFEDLQISKLEELKTKIKAGLRDHFQIIEATLEFEIDPAKCVDPAHGSAHRH